MMYKKENSILSYKKHIRSKNIINDSILLESYRSLLSNKYKEYVFRINSNLYNNKSIVFGYLNNKIMCIYLLEDDYFIVRVNEHNQSLLGVTDKYYVCDQLEGLIKLIDDVQSRKYQYV